MYSCSDILSTDTVFGEEDEPFEGDEYFEEDALSNADENESSISPKQSVPNLSSTESSSISSREGHKTHFLGSSTDSHKTSSFQGGPGNSNGLGFVYPSSSIGSKEDHGGATGIPITHNRRAGHIAPNGMLMATSPSASSPPVFFSLPSPSQFSQVHQQFFDQSHDRCHPLRTLSSSSQGGNFSSEAQYLGSMSPPAQYDGSQLANLGRGRGGDFPHSARQSHTYDEDYYQEGSPDLEEGDADSRHLQTSSDTGFHRRDNVHRLPPNLSHENPYMPSPMYHHHHQLSPRFDEYYPGSGHGLSNAMGNGGTSAPSSPSTSPFPAQNALSKKERNRLAAERCRKKKQDLIASLSRENKLLHQGNIELTRANHYLEQKLDYLINILISMDPTQVVLLKDIHKKASASTNFYMDSNISQSSFSPSIGITNSPGPKYSHSSWSAFSGSSDQMGNKLGNAPVSPLMMPMMPVRASPHHHPQYSSYDPTAGYEYKIDPKQNIMRAGLSSPALQQSK